MSIDAGQTLHHYRLIEKIGEGGMGVVWKAADARLGRTVALKVLHSNIARDGRARERFEREARTISRLNHPHICVLHDVGRCDGVDYLVMEHLEGQALSDRLALGALATEEVVERGIEIAQALHEAHRAGVIHRDLKPANVMLTRYGVKLMDFGLARIVRPDDGRFVSTATTASADLTRAGALVGTIPYMAPEQLDDGDLDARTDVFALGNLLYEMASGRRAFSGGSPARLIAAILTSEPPPPSATRAEVPASLDEVVLRCLAKQPRDRWQSALDVARELERALPAAQARDRPPSRPPRRVGCRIEYFRSRDGASIASARGTGGGPPLLVVPAMVDSIEASWAFYAERLPGHDVVTYDRRGTGLSERGSVPSGAQPYLDDAQAVIDGFGLDELDVLGTLLGTTEAASLAASQPERVRRLVLRSPTLGIDDWASIPGVRAALASMDEDWDYFTESFAQFVVGWGNPNARDLALRLRAVTTRDELRSLLSALATLDLVDLFPDIQAQTLVEHHPGYFFPDLYSRRIAAMIPRCRIEVFTGEVQDFLGDLAIARDFLDET